MSNYYLIEEFLNYLKQLIRENPTKEMSENQVYSLLITYGVPRCEDIKSKFSALYSHFANVPNIYLNEYSNFNFLVFHNGKMSGNEIKLYVPYDSEHIVVAAEKIFGFLAYNNIIHQSKIAYFTRNDDLVIRVNTFEDANKIIEFIRNDAFLMSNLLKINPFLPDNLGIGMTMDNNYSYNSIAARIISQLVHRLRAENRIEDLNCDNLNNFIKQILPSIGILDEKDIYNLLEKVTRKNFRIEEFYDHANEKLKDIYFDRKRQVDSGTYLIHAIEVTEKYYPGLAMIALRNFVYFEDASTFAIQENARSGLLKYTPASTVIPNIKTYLTFNHINCTNIDEAIKLYTEGILRKNVPRNAYHYSNENKGISRYLEDAVKITEKYYPGQGFDALKEYIKEGKDAYFTRKENARKNLTDIVSPKTAMTIVKNHLQLQNISYVNNDEAIEKYIRDVLSRKEPSEYLKEAVIKTERYYPGMGVIALKEYIFTGRDGYFVDVEDIKQKIRKYINPVFAMSIIRSYLAQANIHYVSDEEAIQKYVSNVLKNSLNVYHSDDLDLDYIIESIKSAFCTTLNAYGERQAYLALYSMLYDNDLTYFASDFGERDNLEKISYQHNLKNCVIEYLGAEYKNASVNELFAKLGDIMIKKSR